MDNIKEILSYKSISDRLQNYFPRQEGPQLVHQGQT